MRLADLVPVGLVRRDYEFAGSTTYKFGGPAAWYSDVASIADLETILTARRNEPGPVPLFVLGRGSNVVVSDTGFSGLVIHLTGEFNNVAIEGKTINAGGGLPLPQLARQSVAAGRGGLEFYVGIPGSVGGAVAMNAGGHGSDTAEWLIDATVVDTKTGGTVVEDSVALELSYRHSRIRQDEIVVNARFRSIDRSPEQGEQMMREITAWRRAHQPGGTFNAGSVFKNPPGDAAGRIIDAAGLKGFRCGGVRVSERHANFFVADRDAVARDVYDLVSEVTALVKERAGVELRPEIRFIGEFGGSA